MVVLGGAVGVGDVMHWPERRRAPCTVQCALCTVQLREGRLTAGRQPRLRSRARRSGPTETVCRAVVVGSHQD